MINHTYIIAEAGVNHNGDADMAYQLIDLATDAGADAIKFQTFKAENLVTQAACKAPYQTLTSNAEESQFQMLKALELSSDLHHKLLKYTKQQNIDFLSTPFDIDSLNFLSDDLQLPAIKLSSGDLTNAPLLYEVGKKRSYVILSTGMGTMDEIRAALGMLLIGYFKQKIVEPLFEHAIHVYEKHKEHAYLKNSVSLLQCTSEYPANYADINLRVMDTLRETFQLEIGLSDHSDGIIIPIAAVSRGAEIIEKHITLDKSLPGPDHKASLSPQELHDMVSAIRNVEMAMGSGVKQPCESEQKNIAVVRKGVYARSNIRKDELLNSGNITVKRPENGLSPYDYWRCLGKPAEQDYAADDALSA